MPIGGYQLPKALGDDAQMEEDSSEPSTVGYSQYVFQYFDFLLFITVSAKRTKRKGEKEHPLKGKIKIGF